MDKTRLTPTALAEAVGISVSYASMILKGDRSPGVPVAIAIFRKTGRKLGPIANASSEDIAALERVQRQAAA